MIDLIGGTYREIDYDDICEEVYGSGLRGAKYLLENKCPARLHTAGNKEVMTYLRENQKVYDKFSFNCTEFNELVTFKYNFSLDQPRVFPNLFNIDKTIHITVNSKNIIAFGMLEADFTLTGSKVVYDPQTSIRPIKFSKIGDAEELVYIVNKDEAISIACSESIDEIKEYFFNIENAKALIIKNGPFGATLYLKNYESRIPSYITNDVKKIGSGDIFTTSFGYYWMVKGLTIEESALNASKSTAIYCDKKAYVDTSSLLEPFDYVGFDTMDLSGKQVYLASPFFSISELILIDKIRSTFLSFGIKVFSPFHDIGLGNDIATANKDLEAIEQSEIIFCVLDNLDSGTLIESGYALAKQKKIIGYYRSCDDSKLLMLKPANIVFFQHLTTAIYHTIWSL